MLRNSARALDRTASQISQLSQPCVEAQRGPKPEVQHRAAQSDLQSCLRVAAVRGHCLHSAPAPGLGEPLLLSVPPPSQATCFHMLTCWPADTESSPIPRVRVPCFFCWCRAPPPQHLPLYAGGFGGAPPYYDYNYLGPPGAHLVSSCAVVLWAESVPCTARSTNIRAFWSSRFCSSEFAGKRQ